MTTSQGAAPPSPVTAASTIAIEDLPPHLARDARLLGLDVGTKTIGMALSDVTRSVATPFDTIRRTKFTADADAHSAKWLKRIRSGRW